jgi:hypothetical protein
MNFYYPNHVWLCLERDAFERLYDYKRRRGIPTWEQAIEELLSIEDGPPPAEAIGAQSEKLT